MIRQSPVKGGRQRLGAAVIQEIETKVEQIALRYDCSKSFVIATALAEAFGITKQESYEHASKTKQLNARTRGNRKGYSDYIETT